MFSIKMSVNDALTINYALTIVDTLTTYGKNCATVTAPFNMAISKLQYPVHVRTHVWRSC